MSDELSGVRDRISRVAALLRGEQENSDLRFLELKSEIKKINDTLKQHKDRMYRIERRLRRK